MEAEQPAAIRQSDAEQVDLDDVHQISFGCTNENCACSAEHILPQRLPSAALSPTPICPLAVRDKCPCSGEVMFTMES